MSEWFQQYYLWLQEGPAWHETEYGKKGSTKGDAIYNTLLRIYEQEDYSDWAQIAINCCSLLLKDRQRWPDALSDENDAKNRIDEYWSKLLHKLNIRKFHKYRPQKSITRDPWIVLYLIAVDRNRPDLLYNKPPFWLYRPKIWRWRKRLIKDNRRDYVKRLNYLMSLANVKNYETIQRSKSKG